MADNVKIQFEIDGIDPAVSSVKELEGALKGVEKQSKKTEKTIDNTTDAAKDLAAAAKKTGEDGDAATRLLDEGFGGIGSKIRESFKATKTLGKSFVTSFKAGVKGASSMGKALIATGIGAIIVGVGLLVAYWDDIVGLVSGVSADQEKLLQDTKDTAVAQQDALDSISAQANSLKLAGKSEEEIRQMKIAQTDEIIRTMEVQLALEKEQAEAALKAQKRNKEFAQIVIGILTAPITMLLGAVDALTYGLSQVTGIDATSLADDFTGSIAEFIGFDPEQTKKDSDESLSETERAIEKLKGQRDGIILQSQKANQDAKDKAVQTQKELNDELDLLKAQNIEGAEAQALALLEIERQKNRQILKDKGATDALLLEFDQNYSDQKQAIIDDFDKTQEEKRLANKAIVDAALAQADLDSIENMFERARQELEFQKLQDLEKLKQAGATAEQLAVIEKQYSDKKKAINQDEKDYNDELRELTLDESLNAGKALLGNISSLVGEGTAVGKAAAVASTTIDTYQSANAAYKSVVGIPVVGPALAPVAAGVAVASGLMSVKKILSTKTPGNKSAGGGGVPNIPIPQAYNPDAALESAADGQSQDNQLTLGGNNSSAPVIKAFVVASDMTNQQEADNRINELARL